MEEGSPSSSCVWNPRVFADDARGPRKYLPKSPKTCMALGSTSVWSVVVITGNNLRVHHGEPGETAKVPSLGGTPYNRKKEHGHREVPGMSSLRENSSVLQCMS